MVSVGSALAKDSRCLVVELSPIVMNELSSGGDGGGMGNTDAAKGLERNSRFRLRERLPLEG